MRYFYFLILSASVVWAAAPKFDNVLYGASYYHEYMPYERLDKDIELMQKAGISVVRLGESTWSSSTPRRPLPSRTVRATPASGTRCTARSRSCRPTSGSP